MWTTFCSRPRVVQYKVYAVTLFLYIIYYTYFIRFLNLVTSFSILYGHPHLQILMVEQ